MANQVSMMCVLLCERCLCEPRTDDDALPQIDPSDLDVVLLLAWVAEEQGDDKAAVSPFCWAA